MSYAYYSYDGSQPFYNGPGQFPDQYQQFAYADGYGGYGYAEYSTPARYIHPLPTRPAPPPPLERTPTPPPAEPSSEYLASSLTPQPMAPPDQRKLLIFDLNGTLLLRSPRAYGSQRKIYLRPYARALVAYIAHPDVRAWLDCMVWSSAQAHNVREMVERVFGAEEGAGTGPILRAVWARDTLGLGREAFYQKTQTTKDLAKPWAFFATLNAPRLPSPVYTPTADDNDGTYYSPLPSSPSQPPSSSAPVEHVESISTSPPTECTELLIPPHGPETTLLVDDSPLKARLQPWNHLCVAEYAASDRKRDRAAAGLSADEQKPQASSNTNGALTAELAGLEAEAAAAAAGGDSGKDRWRKRRRGPTEDGEGSEEAGAKLQEEGDAKAGEVPGVSKRARRRERKRLRAAQAAGDVAAETEAGGDESSGSASLGSSSPVRGQAEIEAVEQQAGGVEPASLPVDKHKPNDPEKAAEPDVGSASPVVGTSMLPNTEDIPEVEASLKRKREEEQDGGLAAPPQAVDPVSGAPQEFETPQDAPTPTGGEPYDPTLLAVIGVLSHVRTVGNVAAWVRGGGLVADAGVEPREQEQEAGLDSNTLPADPTQWFTAPRLLHAWAARGRTALSELGIDATHGVE